MCDEILQRFIPKEGTREYELIEIEALLDMASSRISYTKSSKSVTELFNILENELKKNKWYGLYCADISSKKNMLIKLEKHLMNY